MYCKTCKGKRTEQLVTRKFEGSYGHITLHGVPASVCECDEYISLNTGIRISNFLRDINTESEINHFQYETLPK